MWLTESTSVKLASEYELKPPMHREVSIQVETGFQTGQHER